MSQTPSKLERRARALLRAYPAEYRHGRAEEIIGTLLEAAPPGRSLRQHGRPGRCSRAAARPRSRKRRRGVKANVRLALLLGLSIYLSFDFGLTLAASVLGFLPGGGASWLTIAGAALGLAVTLAPWLGSRPVTTALAIPAGALTAYGELRQIHGSETTNGSLSCCSPLQYSPPCPAARCDCRARGSGYPVHSRSCWWRDACCLFCTSSAPAPTFWVTWSWARRCCWRSLWSAGSSPTPAPRSPSASQCCWGGVVLVLPDFFYDDGFLIAHLEALLVLFAIVLPILLPAAWLLLRRQKAPSPRPFPEP